ncbi:hypothetical protein LEMA_P074480.1 [Plenodomus lingam JN3]|uniref:Uncharacterized protein n=1 Tax=Leptosphaeria maculans (strain JN3 / isolate v23.1.3 / race Av1-4-5-6-7-8) TaxID=985895 RepID=E5A8B4_LEPMJ|nr:hypothetical protein LEMA_P074480.1 [Plenodomus lingam JN3]CBX99859.1 hypothetical protein LEMA_P074480.1 [Plenodomus lingam JN3]
MLLYHASTWIILRVSLLLILSSLLVVNSFTPKVSAPAPITHNLARYSRPEQVQLCYQASCKGDLDGVKEQNSSPVQNGFFASLSEAISRKDIRVVQHLLDENVAGGHLPADDAVRSQAYEILALFLTRGWDINEPMGRNLPAVLGIPSSTSDEEMVAWLLDHGADPNSRCDWDLTSTSYAMLQAPLQTIQTLFQRGADPHRGQLLHYTVLRDKPDALAVVRLVVEKGAAVNEVKYEKEPKTYAERKPFSLGTALYRAAEFGKLEIVGYLVDKGADPLKLDSKERTPRFWAEKRGHGEVCWFLRKDADVRSRYLIPQSELHCIASDTWPMAQELYSLIWYAGM